MTQIFYVFWILTLRLSPRGEPNRSGHTLSFRLDVFLTSSSYGTADTNVKIFSGEDRLRAVSLIPLKSVRTNAKSELGRAASSAGASRREERREERAGEKRDCPGIIQQFRSPALQWRSIWLVGLQSNDAYLSSTLRAVRAKFQWWNMAAVLQSVCE